jgi:hypothetical protein
MSDPTIPSECEAARLVAAACRLPEAQTVRERVAAAVPQPSRADVLWLTWVQWRALGRERAIRETGLSLWTLTSRLRQLREAGAPVLSWAQEQDLLARGRFHAGWG